MGRDNFAAQAMAISLRGVQELIPQEDWLQKLAKSEATGVALDFSAEMLRQLHARYMDHVRVARRSFGSKHEARQRLDVRGRRKLYAYLAERGVVRCDAQVSANNVNAA